eukprot:TRINITY_DN389_c0_g1_i1.p1 TRINITY_DN389_c0_g1~~TRINITY_DN389_c0_g1_i1.p1  ORF type:complete len:106 (-),score=30.04 TRINITY_DN389_c0_g1_i1:297-614(-)
MIKPQTPQQQPHHYPQPQEPQPYTPLTPPQQHPFAISLQSPWVMLIGAVLALVLSVNLIFMCYVNCIRGDSRSIISFARRRRYTPVKDADSEFYSEHEAINVASD